MIYSNLRKICSHC